MDNPLFRPSAFWSDLAARNKNMITNEGLENFKRTVANNYFNWLVTSVRHPNFPFAFRKWLRHPDVSPILSKIGDSNHLHNRHTEQLIALTEYQRQIYRLYVGFLWAAMCQNDPLGLRNQVTESEIGNPIRIESNGRLISQDLANSIVECNTIVKLLSEASKPRLLELGAGYGRLAHVFTATQEGQYFILDIEPAIDVAQWYLTSLFGPQKVRRIQNLEDAGDASVVLIDAKKIEAIPGNYFNLVFSISTLPELTQEQASFYLTEFQRLSKGHIFLKQWNTWKNPSDGTWLTRNSYQLGPQWAVVIDQPDPLVPNFFNRAWRKI
jgi:putative sugar O-methyltransferase